MDMRDGEEGLTGNPRRHGMATYLAATLLFIEAALLVPATVLVVMIAGAFADWCWGDASCLNQPSTRDSKMLLAGVLGGSLVLLYAAAGVGLRRGWRRARAAGMSLGLLWCVLGFAAGPFVVVFMAMGLITTLVCTYVPDPVGEAG